MDTAVRDFIGTPEHLIRMAKEGRFGKQALVTFLAAAKRDAYLAACAAVEKEYTDACAASGDPCLAGGCAVEGEICLQPLLAADIGYFKRCGEEWARLFADPANRADQWRTVS